MFGIEQKEKNILQSKQKVRWNDLINYEMQKLYSRAPASQYFEFVDYLIDK